MYWTAVVIRVGVQIWVALQVIDDIMVPWEDPVRAPFVDDPLGGVVDHHPDWPVIAGIVDYRAQRRDANRKQRTSLAAVS